MARAKKELKKDNVAEDKEEHEGEFVEHPRPGSAEKSVAKKGEEDDEDEDEMAEENPRTKGDTDEDEDETETEKCGTKKAADLTTDDLEKSLGKLIRLAGEGDTASRKAFLLEKAQGENLTKAEQAELFEILGGKAERQPAESLGDRVVKGLEDNDTIQKALDVSEYLDEQHREVVGAFRSLSDCIEKSDTRQGEFNLILARAIAETGKLIKSMSERLGVVESQPVRGPKSQGLRALEKGFVGQAAQENALSKSMVLDELEKMIVESVDKGMGGAMDNGIDLGIEASKYEQTNKLHPMVAAEVQRRIQGTARA
jgi:hypothetical protein